MATLPTTSKSKDEKNFTRAVIISIKLQLTRISRSDELSETPEQIFNSQQQPQVIYKNALSNYFEVKSCLVYHRGETRAFLIGCDVHRLIRGDS